MPATKLTVEDVRQIKIIHSRGQQTPRELARFYRVGAETIRRILRGETWLSVTDQPLRSEEELNADAAASEARMVAMIAAERTRQALPTQILEEISELQPTAQERLRSFGLEKK